MNTNLNDYMQSYLAHLKSCVMWFHAAHHVTKGPGFMSDHKDLYGNIYTQLDTHFDSLIEKSIALSGDESIACPLQLSVLSSHILNNQYDSPVNRSSQEIAEMSIKLVANLINSTSNIYEVFEESNMLTLGLDDTLTSHANEYENFLYFLGQRYKS